MILVTGATGFVGNALVQHLATMQPSSQVVAASRNTGWAWPVGAVPVQTGDLVGSTDWTRALRDVNTIVHCAARVHVMHERTSDPLVAFRQVNVEGTLNLARQAARLGVGRFVFVSSIKVNGESTQLGRPFTASDTAAAVDPYGISKHEAELGLRELSSRSGMEVVIVRPPLVYGPGVRANFASMVRWVARGIPLPLGDIDNLRSMVGLDNLVDLLTVCACHNAAAGHTFLVSDGEDVSTPELLRRTAQAMGKKARLFPVPASLLERGAALLGKRALAQRLCGSLQLDISETRLLLGWQPPLSLDEGLRKTVRGMAL